MQLRLKGIATIVILIKACVIMALFQACSDETQSVRIYKNSPQVLLGKVEWICGKADIPQFLVRDRKLYVQSKKDGKTIHLKHVNTSLPDGYYFCTKQSHRENSQRVIRRNC